MKDLNRYLYICFYTIVRPASDPRKPPDYRPLAPFWKSRGYVEHPELIGTISYQEIGETEETPKEMVFWIKEFRKKPIKKETLWISLAQPRLRKKSLPENPLSEAAEIKRATRCQSNWKTNWRH